MDVLFRNLFLIATLLIWCVCGPLPIDPSDNPLHADVNISAIDGNVTIPARLGMYTNQKYTISFSLSLEMFIDYVTVTITDQHNNTIEYNTIIKKPWNMNSFNLPIILTSAGTKLLNYTAWLTNGVQKSKTFLLDVMSNDPPVVFPSTVEFCSEAEKTAIRDIAPYIFDPDGDSLTIEIEQNGNGRMFTLEGTDLTIKNSSDAGSYPLKIKVTDVNSSVTFMVLWTVYLPYPGDVILIDDHYYANAGQLCTLTVLDNDSVPYSSIVSYISYGHHGVSFISNGTIGYLPDSTFSGYDTIQYYVNGKSNAAAAYITVLDPNSDNLSPQTDSTISPDYMSVVQGSSSSINVLQNDFANGIALTMEALLQGTLGQATIGNDGVIHYTAEADAEGSDTVRYILNTGDTGACIINIITNSVIVRNDSASVIQGQKRVINVLDNDTIPNGVLKITGAVANGELGTVSFNDSTVTYKATNNAVGIDKVVYTVNGGIADGNIVITILQIDIITFPDTIICNEDDAAIRVDVLANDTITPGHTLVLSEVRGALLGKAMIDKAANMVLYTPTPDKYGEDLVFYTVNNAKLCTLIVTIKPVGGDKPFFSHIQKIDTVDEGSVETFTVKALDPDNTVVSLGIKNNPDWITDSIQGDSMIVTLEPSYTIVSGETPEVIPFTITAGSGGDIIEEEITIYVRNVNTEPAFFDPPDTITVDEGVVKKVGFFAVDSDGDPLAFNIDTVPWITTNAAMDTLFISPQNVVPIGAETFWEDIVITISDGVHTVSHTLTVVVKKTDSGPHPVASITTPGAGDTVNVESFTITAEARKKK